MNYNKIKDDMEKYQKMLEEAGHTDISPKSKRSPLRKQNRSITLNGGNDPDISASDSDAHEYEDLHEYFERINTQGYSNDDCPYLDDFGPNDEIIQCKTYRK
jgi:hypothetical protein